MQSTKATGVLFSLTKKDVKAKKKISWFFLGGQMIVLMQKLSSTNKIRF